MYVKKLKCSLQPFLFLWFLSGLFRQFFSYFNEKQAHTNTQTLYVKCLFGWSQFDVPQNHCFKKKKNFDGKWCVLWCPLRSCYIRNVLCHGNILFLLDDGNALWLVNLMANNTVCRWQYEICVWIWMDIFGFVSWFAFDFCFRRRFEYWVVFLVCLTNINSRPIYMHVYVCVLCSVNT